MKRNKSYKFMYVLGIKGNKLLSMYSEQDLPAT
jgi:hypothetical protein